MVDMKISNMLVKMMSDIQKAEGTNTAEQQKYSVGQTIEALIIAKEGDSYLLQEGTRSFSARAESPLPLGETVQLLVLEINNEAVILKLVSPLSENSDKPDEKIKQIIRKFGVTGEKEIMQTKLESIRIPCDENSAVKYLLDPHLLLALLIPGNAEAKEYQKLEIYEYKGQGKNGKTSEVCFKLDFDELGRIEILMRYIDNSIYTRIWAELAETKRLLEDNRKTLISICSHTEIVATFEGPLFRNEVHENVDVRI